MKINNKKELIDSVLREQAVEVMEAGLKSVQPEKLVKSSVRYNEEFNSLSIQNSSYELISGRIFIIGGGKAAGKMAEEIEKVIGVKNITAGLVNCLDTKYKTKKIKIHKASHPLPDKNSCKGTEKMLEFKEKYGIGEKDLVIFLLSGGGSSMISCPVEGVTLDDQQKIYDLLLSSGANIQEMNTIKKHLSTVKGGRMGKFFEPARVVSIVISDVLNNDLSVIASGPTFVDESTYMDARMILDKHSLLEKIPENALDYIDRGVRGEEPDTPKKLKNCSNHVIGDVSIALEAMALRAKELNLKPLIVTSKLSGNTTKLAKGVEKVLNGEYGDYDILFLGGETYPILPDSHGVGGRNTHYALVSLMEMQKYENDWVMMSVASDGVDYVKESAGVIIDNTVYANVRSKGLNMNSYIEQYDSFNFFRKLGNSIIEIQDSHTNVGDLILYLLK